MKLGKLSLVAVMALGTSAFAIDNVKVSGEAKLWYQTSEYSGDAVEGTAAESQDFFDKDPNSMAEVALKVGATADLLPSLSAGIKAVGLSTLGLENNLVGAVPAAKFNNDGTSASGQLDDQGWIEELYLAYTMGKTTAKVGRQALATPLAFTEDWNVVDNTFEAAVLLNNDLPDTTLVGAWVGKDNGVGTLVAGRGTTVVHNGKFETFGDSGAYAAGAITKLIPQTTAQAWYYNVSNVADAYWLQADAKLFDIVSVGAQFAGMMPKLSEGVVTAAGYPAGAQNLDVVKQDSEMFAMKVGVDISQFNVYAAYSTVNEGTLGFANVATGDKTMAYTGLGSIYMDGEIVVAPDTDAWKIGASTKIVPGFMFATSYCAAETGDNQGALAAVGGASKPNTDYNAWDLIAKTKTGPVDWTAIFTQYAIDGDNNPGDGSAKDKDTDSLRIIASLKF